jgi:hypothetical protein
MAKIMVIQGREVTSDDIQLIRRLMEENPSWHRTRLSRELCAKWKWCTLKGQYKDMACRTLLLKLERQGHITLPPRRKKAYNAIRHQSIQYVLHSTSPICCDLKSLLPLQISTVQSQSHDALFTSLLCLYHYLGYSGTVGEHMKYLICDRHQTPLACLLFGSAAWKIASRDTFIGWDAETRQRNLHFITNNMRFLILPWVRVGHLASHLLSLIAKRIDSDWQQKYGHPIYLLETFVESGRFQGTCYKAANWHCVGQTTGRTRNDRYNSIHKPVKDIYLYPLTKDFRESLGR